MVEQCTVNAPAVGSSPTIPAILPLGGPIPNPLAMRDTMTSVCHYMHPRSQRSWPGLSGNTGPMIPHDRTMGHSHEGTSLIRKDFRRIPVSR